MIDFTQYKDDKKIVKVIESHYKRLKDERTQGDYLMRLLQKIFLPRRWDILRQGKKGQQYGARIYDQHPANSGNKFVLGLLGYMISRSVPWIAFGSSNQRAMEEDAVKEYLQEIAEIILWSIGQSNFYGSSIWTAKDANILGTGIAIPEEDLAHGRLIYHTPHPGENYLAEDEFGRSAVYMRPHKLTALTLLNKFGKDKLPDEVKKHAKAERDTDNPFKEYDVLYAVYKNIKPIYGSLNPEDKRYKVFWILRKTNQVKDSALLAKTGKDNFPIAWRVGKEPGWAYGTSLAADTLTAALIGNKLGEKILEKVHKDVSPALRAHKNLRPLNRNANGITWFDKAEETVHELYRANTATLISEEFLRRIDGQIEDNFFIRFFEALHPGEGPARTAYEVSQLKGQTAILMTTIVAEMQEQYLNEVVQTHFDFETEAGNMPPVPDILFDTKYNQNYRQGMRQINARTQGSVDMVDIDVQYIGPLGQAQRSLIQSQGIIDGLALVNQISQMWPNALIKINELELIEDALIAQNFPQKLFKSDEEVAQILEMQAEKERLQEEAAMAIEGAKAVPLGKAIEPNSPAEMLAGAVA